MDKMRQEMWKRAKRTAYNDAINNAAAGHPCATILYEMELIEQKNLIFGSLFINKANNQLTKQNGGK